MNINLIRLPIAAERRGVSRSTFYGEIKNGLMVPPVRPGEKPCLFPEHEINEINRAIVAGKTDEEIKNLVKHLIASRKQSGVS